MSAFRRFELLLAAALAALLGASLLRGLGIIELYPLWPWEQRRDGLIVVDSPEVYTRERLVNDRFMQTTWLLNQLREYNRGAEFQEAVDTLRERGIEVGVGFSSAGDASAERRDAQADDSPRPSALTRPGLSAIERFRDTQAFRTEVRQAVLETMLDDRHDLQGNTLYMLKFDAAIIPPRRMQRRNFAVVAVNLQSDTGRREADPDETYSTGPGPGADANLDEVYDAWVEHVRGMVTNEYLNRVRIFLGRKTDETELIEMWDAMDFDSALPEPDDPRARVTDRALSHLERFLADYRRVEGFRAAYDHTRKVCGPEPDSRTPAHRDWQHRLGQQPPNRLIQGYFTDLAQPAGPGAGTFSEQLFEQFRRRLLLRAATRAPVPSDGDPSAATDPSNIAAGTYADWLAHANALMAVAYNAGEDASQPGNEAVAQTAAADQRPWSERLERILESGKLGDCDAVRNLDKTLAAEQGIELAAFFDASQRLFEHANAAWELERFLLFQTLGSYYHRLLEKRLGKLANFDLRCDSDAQLCRVRVNESCPAGPPASGSADACKAPPGFYDELASEHSSFFTYAATPKENARGVLSSLEQQDTASLRGSAAVPGRDDLGGQVAIADERTERRLAAERRIRVMGFGGTGKADTRPYFGWMIAPPRVGDEAQPIQQSLTAIVSLPSWWQRIRLVVRTCWRGERGFPELEVHNGRACLDADSETASFPVNLPWNVRDINRKLAYEIRRVPYIETLNGDFAMIPFPVYHVGQENARLLIEGGDLWRSTVVTLGSQRANEILVLPNMRGIIATFEKIELPSSPRPCKTEVPIRVWTSEGVTMEDAARAIVFASKDRDNDPSCDRQGPAPASAPPDAQQLASGATAAPPPRQTPPASADTAAPEDAAAPSSPVAPTAASAETQ